MISVDKMESIRRRSRRGESVAGIARAEGVSEPTVRKYARMADLSPEPPRATEVESPTLAPHEATIDSWLEDDCRNWRKQRHTAVRVYVRLREEEGYEGSYSTVQRYCQAPPGGDGRRGATRGTRRATSSSPGCRASARWTSGRPTSGSGA